MVVLFLYFFVMTNANKKLGSSITVRNTCHTRHHTKNVVVNSVDSDLGSGSSGNSSRGKNKLKNSIVDSGEVAGSRWLVLLRAKGEGVDVDTSVRGTGVVLEWLNNVEV